MIYIMNCASGSKPGFYYGLPKIYKANAPLRTIISSVGTFCHPTAKFLANLLLPLTKNDNILNEAFDFVDHLKSISVHAAVMVSINVGSLLTKLPLLEILILLYNGFMIKMELLQQFHAMA